MKLCNDLTQAYQDELHRPPFPYKFKIKCAGCPNDCVAAAARADLSIIGMWKDDIQQDDAAVAEYAAAGLDIQKDVCDRCPSRCMSWDGQKLTIENSECVRCMHCINVMPKALRPGKERGAAILIGSKAPIVNGALLSSVLVPFVPEAELFETLKELIKRIWEFWDEYGKNRERVGELIQRVGMANFLDAIGLDPVPEMVTAPRDNPYIFFQSKDRVSEEMTNDRLQPKRITDIGPPNYEKFLPPVIKRNYGKWKYHENARSRRALPRRRIGREALHRAGRLAAPAERPHHPAVRRPGRQVLRRLSCASPAATTWSSCSTTPPRSSR